jgi:hypothetical protein
VSNLRQPPTDPNAASESSADIDSSFPTESVRYGSYKPAALSLNDIAPTSTRTERPPQSSYPQRISSLAAASTLPARAPSSSANVVAAPQSVRGNKGVIYLTVRLLEKKNGAFFISRLILASGINLRSFDANTYDDPVTVMKFIKTLRNMLSPIDMVNILTQTPLHQYEVRQKREEP